MTLTMVYRDHGHPQDGLPNTLDMNLCLITAERLTYTSGFDKKLLKIYELINFSFTSDKKCYVI
jgi:hypothetical protein